MRLLVGVALVAGAALGIAAALGVPWRDGVVGLLVATALLLGRSPRDGAR